MRLRAGTLLAAGALLIACELKDDEALPRRGDADAAATNTGAADAASPQASVIDDSLVAVPAFDTLFVTRIDTILVRRAAQPLETPPSAHKLDVAGRAPAPSSPSASTPSAATATEIAVLKLGIVIPVHGVAVSSLRDTYTESRGSRAHDAIDIPAPRGTPVISATAGRVVQLHNSRAGGLMVYAADQTDRFILLYGHLDRYAPGLRVGMPLVPGQQLGAVGTTGNAPQGTPHLHFAVLRGKPSETWWSGTAINPYPLFRP